MSNKIIEIIHKPSFLAGFDAGYHHGLNDTSESMSNYAVIQLHYRAVESVMARIDEIAQFSKGMPRDTLFKRLKSNSAKLAELTAEFKNHALEYGYKSEEIAKILSNSSDMQDGIATALQSGDIEPLRGIWKEHDINKQIAPKVDATYKRSNPLIGERRYVGERAKSLRQFKDFQGHGGFIEIGHAILAELRAKESRTEEENKVIKWLKTYESDRSKMSKEVSRAYRDYKNYEK